jgi:hypothetical protein
MRHVYACQCGAETECNPKDLSLGAVFECPRCLDVRAHVYPRRGGRAWIKVSDSDVSFHDLLGHRHDDEDDEIDSDLLARS